MTTTPAADRRRPRWSGFVAPARIVLLLALSACPGPTGGTPANGFVSAGTALRHEASGMTFPEAAGAFRRVSINQYDAKGLDVSAGYDAEMPRLAALTIYVYQTYEPLYSGPDGLVSQKSITDLIRTEFQRREHEIEMRPEYSNITRLAEHPIQTAAGKLTMAGWHADYRYETLFARQRQEVVSELEVFCDAATRWCLEYRLTRPENSVDDETLDAVKPLFPVTIAFRPQKYHLF